MKGDQFLRKTHLGAAKPDLKGQNGQILIAGEAAFF